MSDLSLPNTRAPFLDENGNISRIWWKFLNDLFARVGGGTATDLTAITNLLAALTISVNDDKLDATFSDTAALMNLASRIEDLSQQAIGAPDIAGLLAKISDLETRLELITAPVMPSVPELTVATLLNSWVNYDATHTQAGYYKAYGRVYLCGFIKSGTLALPAFTLPSGYRPAYRHILAVNSADAFGGAYVDTNGDVVPYAGNNAAFSLDNISFRVT